ncbi:hypothetical protein COV12_00210 [Candidatus Woesearchaeota archaeon CG10_big_fil_rev_8_21_14_0_10_32_24]|nr:MAG: hypothetical protein COV12_00210 [Candidatus Woesearchaeota archaeon CG10_big_fil_rev_8_21_14_0_10_32_24]
MSINYIKQILAPFALAIGLATAGYAPSASADKPHTTVRVQDVKEGKTRYDLTTRRIITVPSNTSLDDVVGLPQQVTPVGLPSDVTPVGLPDSVTPVYKPRGVTPVTVTKTVTNYVPILAGLPEVGMGVVLTNLNENHRGVSDGLGIDATVLYHPTGRRWALGVHYVSFDADSLVNHGTNVKTASEGPLAGKLTLTETHNSDAALSAKGLGLTLQNNTLLYDGKNVGLGLGLTAGGLNKKTTWNETILASKSIDGVVMQGAESFQTQGGVDESTSPYLRLAVPLMIKTGNNGGGGVCVTPSVMYSLEGDRVIGLSLGYCRNK